MSNEKENEILDKVFHELYDISDILEKTIIEKSRDDVKELISLLEDVIFVSTIVSVCRDSPPLSMVKDYVTILLEKLEKVKNIDNIKEHMEIIEYLLKKM